MKKKFKVRVRQVILYTVIVEAENKLGAREAAREIGRGNPLPHPHPTSVDEKAPWQDVEPLTCQEVVE